LGFGNVEKGSTFAIPNGEGERGKRFRGDKVHCDSKNIFLFLFGFRKIISDLCSPLRLTETDKATERKSRD